MVWCFLSCLPVGASFITLIYYTVLMSLRFTRGQDSDLNKLQLDFGFVFSFLLLRFGSATEANTVSTWQGYDSGATTSVTNREKDLGKLCQAPGCM